MTPHANSAETLACPFCRQNALFLLRDRNRDFFQCPDCGFILVPPAQHLPPDDEKARYLLHNNSMSEPGYVAMFAEKIAWAETHCPGARTVLDYGCGPGPVLAELCRKKGYAADIYDPFFFPEGAPGGKRYDLVFCTETVEHFRRPSEDWRNLFARVAPGGHLAVMTRFYTHPGGQPGDFRAWYYKNDPTHIAFYPEHMIVRLARSFGSTPVFSNKKDFIILRSPALAGYDDGNKGSPAE